MSFSIVDYDPWPRVSADIQVERARRIGDLLHVATIEGMRAQQGFIEALDWVLAQAQPKPQPKHDEED